MSSKIIKTHKELAQLIAGKKILHSNSLGKDSVLCLEWLTRAAKPNRIVSVFLEFQACHPDDKRYLAYLKKRFPTVDFVALKNPVELNLISDGIYQSPVDVNYIFHQHEYGDFDMRAMIQEQKQKYGCDFICDGSSKYESFARRTKFHQKGLEFKGTIYPLGMMSKQEVLGLIKATGMKLHPSYKVSKSSYDHPSYWKMRNGFIANPQFYRNVLKMYPLMVLDKYRYEVLMKGCFDGKNKNKNKKT